MRKINLFLTAILISFTYQAQAQDLPDSCLAAYSFRIVVIGSSTAAGAGASPVDSAWVNRYRSSLYQYNLANKVFNLARGGYNTYHLMPSDAVPPANRPVPDTLRNITRALSLNPQAIIINLPSNDAAAGYTAEEQLNNFDTIIHTARNAGVPIWVCTTQPRNFSASQVAIQELVRDSILAKYGQQAINFWNGVATSDGYIDPFFDSGDGIHLNNPGHALLFNRVRDKAIPISLAELPDLTVKPDTLCSPGNAQLLAVSQYADTIFWYLQAQAGLPVGSGPVFTTPVLDESTTYYASAHIGPFSYARQLFTTNSINRDWNGIMFDIVADTALTVDSLTIQLQTGGPQTVQVYSRAGSLLGWEQTAAAWQFLDSFQFSMNTPGSIVSLPVGPLQLSHSDTLAFYLHMANPGANLAYNAPDDNIVYQTPELQLLNSTGISHQFGQTYFPRLYVGRVSYHYGFKPEGSCSTERLAVPVLFGHTPVDLGADTLVLVSDSLALDAGPGYLQYHWSTGSTSQQIWITSALLQPGANTLTVSVTDSLGCQSEDSLQILYLPSSAQELDNVIQLQIKPNPGRSSFIIQADPPQPVVEVSVFNNAGQLVFQNKGALPMEIQSDFGQAGMYWVQIKGPGFQRTLRWLKSD